VNKSTVLFSFSFVVSSQQEPTTYYYFVHLYRRCRWL